MKPIGQVVVSGIVGFLMILAFGVEAPIQRTARTLSRRGKTPGVKTTSARAAELPFPSMAPTSEATPPVGTIRVAERGVTALMQMPLADLREIVRTSANPFEVQGAIWSIGNHLVLSDEDVAALKDRLNHPESQTEEVLKTLVWALSLKPDTIPIETIAALATGHASAAVRRAAVRAIGTLEDPRAREAIVFMALHDLEPCNRCEAIFFQTLHVDPASAVELSRVALGLESEPTVRAQWMNLVGAHPSAEGRALMEAVACSGAEDPVVRSMAAEMLGGEGR